jgi:two-component system NtrC family sensor kinase
LQSQVAKILIVDDETVHMQALCRTLQTHAFETVGFSDPLEALAASRENPFDLLLTDLRLPGLDGIGLLRQIQQSNPDTVGIIMTGQGSIESAVSAMTAGAFDYIQKPFRLSLLLPILKRAVSVRRLRMENRRLSERLALRVEELETAHRELKATQAQLVHSEKMAGLGQLVAGIAHEINNPLAYTLSHCRTAAHHLAAVLGNPEAANSPEALEKLATVQDRVGELGHGLKRIHALMLNLRTFSRVDEGEFKPIDVTASIDSVLDVLKHKLGDRIEIVTDYGEPRILSCNPASLNQVFLHLVTNAIEAIEGTGRISIATRRVGKNFEISIKDTGRGIPKALQQRVFEPFFTTKELGDGMGLGLAISYAIAVSHAGTLELHSEENAGTEAVIRVPWDDASEHQYAE